MPTFIIYEDRLRRNLELITGVASRSGAKIIMAFKANAAWRTFDVMRQYNRDFTASSLNELALGMEEMGGEAHVFSPAYTDTDIEQYLAGATHITFNSLSQLERFGPLARERGVSVGLRVNPRCSVIETDIYNPALPGSRLGVPATALSKADKGLPALLDGLHFHALCESSAADLAKVLAAFEGQFGHLLPGLKWVNFGGGHLMTREGYDVEGLVGLLLGFKERHPGLEVILEPGSAWTWRTGDLEASVVDVVEYDGVRTALLDVSFACHMPDCLEMPYTPTVSESSAGGRHMYRLGGNTCLNGDVCPGEFRFDRPLQVGDKLTFEDMNHYTTVKTNMFNGVAHPDMVMVRADGSRQLLRHFDYVDYKNRMD